MINTAARIKTPRSMLLSDEELTQLCAPWEQFDRQFDYILLRCAICGFIIDQRYEATKPTMDWTTRGRHR